MKGPSRATRNMTSGLSPLALTQAHADWAQHLLLSPDKQIELVHKAARKWARFFFYCSHGRCHIVERRTREFCVSNIFK
jgi:hypothetical protein